MKEEVDQSLLIFPLQNHILHTTLHSIPLHFSSFFHNPYIYTLYTCYILPYSPLIHFFSHHSFLFLSCFFLFPIYFYLYHTFYLYHFSISTSYLLRNGRDRRYDRDRSKSERGRSNSERGRNDERRSGSKENKVEYNKCIGCKCNDCEKMRKNAKELNVKLCEGYDFGEEILVNFTEKGKQVMILDFSSFFHNH